MDVENQKTSYRRAGVKDVETLVECRVRFLNELCDHPDDENAESLKKTLREYFSKAIPSGEFIAWLAEYEGKVVGTGGMVVWELPARYGGLESGKAGYVLNMYTVPEARRKGVCTRLLNELLEEARSMGLKYLHLHASEDGKSIYKKAGFVEPEQTELKLNM